MARYLPSEALAGRCARIVRRIGSVQNFFVRLGTWRPEFLSVLRIVTALLFLEHATMKLFGFPPSQMPASTMFSGFWWIGVLELVGSLLLIAGYWTRIAAFILSGEMAVAYWLAHAPNSPFPISNYGESAILFCFVFLYIAAAGAGSWSVDARQGRP
jgi:putative oxidoreductase